MNITINVTLPPVLEAILQRMLAEMPGKAEAEAPKTEAPKTEAPKTEAPKTKKGPKLAEPAATDVPPVTPPAARPAVVVSEANGNLELPALGVLTKETMIACGVPAVRAIIKKFAIANLNELAPEKYSAFATALHELRATTVGP